MLQRNQTIEIVYGHTSEGDDLTINGRIIELDETRVVVQTDETTLTFDRFSLELDLDASGVSLPPGY